MTRPVPIAACPGRAAWAAGLPVFPLDEIEAIADTIWVRAPPVGGRGARTGTE